MSGEGETRRERLNRHVWEGSERLERQRALIAELVLDGHDRLVPAARRCLAQMEEYQAVLEELLHEREDW